MLIVVNRQFAKGILEMTIPNQPPKSGVEGFEVPKPIEFTRWVLHPPHGMSFKNEMGAEMSIRFEKGRESELYQVLYTQLLTLYAQSQPKPEIVQEASPKEKLVVFKVDEHGNLIVPNSKENEKQ